MPPLNYRAYAAFLAVWLATAVTFVAGLVNVLFGDFRYLALLVLAAILGWAAYQLTKRIRSDGSVTGGRDAGGGRHGSRA